MPRPILCYAWTALAASSMPGVAFAEGAAATPPATTTASETAVSGASAFETVPNRYGNAEMSLFMGLGSHPPWNGSWAVRIDAEVVAQTSWSWLTVGPAVSLTLEPGKGPVVIDVGLAFTAYIPDPFDWRRWHWGLEVAPAVAYVWMRDDEPDRAGASFRLAPFFEVNVQREPTYDTYIAAEDELEALESERTTCGLLERLPKEGRPAIDRLRRELREHCDHVLPPSGALQYLEQSFPTRGVRFRVFPAFILRTVKDPVGIPSLNLAVLFP